ncbi:hypothetical protein ACWGQ2_12575 [Arthrobacter sp. NPDC055585]
MHCQRASIALGGAALLRNSPGAQTLLLRENEDGEGQYEVLTIRDGNNDDLAEPDDCDEWGENTVGGEGPELASMPWRWT